jgi:GntR family transcriptional regulator
MTEIMTPGNPTLTYVCVADAIAVRIVSGGYTGKLPAERELAQEFDVAYETLRRAMCVLRDRKLVVTRQGGGNFVRTTD